MAQIVAIVAICFFGFLAFLSMRMPIPVEPEYSVTIKIDPPFYNLPDRNPHR